MGCKKRYGCLNICEIYTRFNGAFSFSHRNFLVMELLAIKFDLNLFYKYMHVHWIRVDSTTKHVVDSNLSKRFDFSVNFFFQCTVELNQLNIMVELLIQ